MTPAEQAIECIEFARGLLAVHGERIRCRLPEDAAHLLEELLVHRDEVLLVLRQRDDVPAMPAGVRLVRWKQKEAPLS